MIGELALGRVVLDVIKASVGAGTLGLAASLAASAPDLSATAGAPCESSGTESRPRSVPRTEQAAGPGLDQTASSLLADHESVTSVADSASATGTWATTNPGEGFSLAGASTDGTAEAVFLHHAVDPLTVRGVANEAVCEVSTLPIPPAATAIATTPVEGPENVIVGTGQEPVGLSFTSRAAIYRVRTVARRDSTPSMAQHRETV